MRQDTIKVEDDYILALRFMNQTKRYRNVEFHKFKFNERGTWRTYYYLDEIDADRLINNRKC